MEFLHSDEFLCSDHPVAEEAYIQLAAVFTQVRQFNQSEFFTIEKPKVPLEGTVQKEKQISVDPLSIKESENSPPLIQSPKKESHQMLLPVIASPRFYGVPPPHPAKSKFLSYSLPGSAASSPKFSSAIPKKKPHNPLAHQHSFALSRLAQLREKHLQRSKSCGGEGRISAVNDEFILWLTQVNSRRYNNPSRNDQQHDDHVSRQDKLNPCDDEDFKCGAMCLFLPGFGKGKSVRSSRKVEPETPHVISRSVSLERFECASWTSSALINDNDAGDSSKFFDLPLELIQCSESTDTNTPVRAAFVFKKDQKGIIKKSVAARGTAGRKSHESSSSSSPHVQFSSSSHAPYITPRLQKAREEFNAFLEAQSA